MPRNYDIIASAAPSSTSNSVTFNQGDYVQNLPNTGVIRAIVYYNDNVISNFSNAVEIQADNTPPTIGNPLGLKINIIKAIKSTLQLILQTVQMVLELNLQM